ncbi:hypothetical protein WAI453_001297 [Rhynchosporium graminicola]
MPRRPHQKSRNGCLGCKKRHVKCNEGRPECRNCLNTASICIYQNAAPASGPQSPAVHTNSSMSSLPSPAATNPAIASSYWSPASEQPSMGQGVVNMLHLELLHHAKSVGDSVDCFGISREECRSALEEVVQHGFKAPYLMHEFLSLAATHLSILRPRQSTFFRNQATELQTSALSMFNAEIQGKNGGDLSSDYFSRFVFSSILGAQMLYDTIAYRDGDFTNFVNDFVRYLRVTKGVTINIQGCWEQLHETSLRPFLEAGNRALAGGTESISPECERLSTLLDSADLGPSSKKAYQAALEFLQAAYHADRLAVEVDQDQSSSVLYGARTGVYAWSILVPVEYSELLLQRRPEALAILAHYAILLHRYRTSWLTGDGGRYMIEAITNFLGPYWEPWLATPNEELRNDP